MWIFFNIQSDFKTQIQKVSDQIKDIYLPSTLKIDSTSQHFPHQHFFFLQSCITDIVGWTTRF